MINCTSFFNEGHVILNYLLHELYQVLRVFVHNNKYFLLKIKKKVVRSVKQESTFFKFIKNLRVDRPIFLC